MKRDKVDKGSIHNNHFLELAQERLMLEASLVKSVDINTRDIDGRNALFWAIKTSHKHNTNLLLSHGISFMVKPKYHAFFHSIENNNLDVFSLLLKSSEDINMRNEKGQTLLMVAIEKENSVMVQYLINHNINLYTNDNKGLTALDYAKKVKNRMIFELVHYKILYQKTQIQKVA